MRRFSIAILALGAILVGSILANATEPPALSMAKSPPALSPPPLEIPSVMDSFMRYGGFNTQSELETWKAKETLEERIEALEARKECDCDLVSALSSPVERQPATKTITRYRTEIRQTGRMVQDCSGGVCVMVPETTTVSIPYTVEVPLGSEEAVYQAPLVTATSDGNVCPDCGQFHALSSSNSSENTSTGLLYRANGRQKLFQPFRRLRLRMSTGRLFPNAWWNR